MSARTVASALALFAAKQVDFGQVIEDLDSLGVGYVIVGGIAVHHHGYERFTKDVDVVVNKSDLHKLKESDKFRVNDDGCGPDFWSVEHVGTGTHLDVLVGGSEGFPRVEQMQRSDSDKRYVSLSDLVVLKAFRGELTDLGDVERLLQKRGLKAVDWDHVFSLVKNETAREHLKDVIKRVENKKDKPEKNPWAEKDKKQSWWKIW